MLLICNKAYTEAKLLARISSPESLEAMIVAQFVAVATSADKVAR